MTIGKMYKNFKPMRFFSSIALLLAVIATLFFVPVLLEYFETGLVERFPTLIVCGFVYIAAIQSFFAGLMLSTMRQKDRQDFEMHLISIDNEYREKIKEV